MKKYNSLYATLFIMLTIISPSLGMKNWMSQSTITPSWHPNISVEEAELHKSQSLDIADESYNNFKQTCSRLPLLLNNLKVAEKKELNDLENSIIQELSHSIEFITQRDTSIINPQSSQRINILNAIKESLENKKSYNNKRIDQWKKIIEKSCNLTINNIEKIELGNITALEKSSLLVEWPNTPEEQIMYLDTKNWNIPTKTYILQLLWWNTKQTLKTVPKNAPYNIKTNINNHNNVAMKQMHIFGDALTKMNQSFPIITQEKDKQPYPKFTYQLAKIPKDIDPKLKTMLWNSLNKEQRNVYKQRVALEDSLHESDKILQEYKILLQNNDIARKEKINLLEQYKDRVEKHKELLTQYLPVLQNHETKLKEKTQKGILVNQNTILDIQNKIEQLQEIELLLNQRAQEIASKVTKEIEQERLEQEKIEQGRLERERLQQLAKQERMEQQQIEREINDALQREAEEQQRQFQSILDQEKQKREKLEQERLAEQQKIDRERQEQQRLEQEQTNAQRIPWITNKFNQIRQGITNFFSPVISTLTSWWSWLIGR